MPRPFAASHGDARYRWSVLAVVFVGTFMAPLDSSIVNVALPSLSAFFGRGMTSIEWVVTAYLLTTSSLLLSAGRLGDMFGHKGLYIFGFVVFTGASLACGLSGTLGMLVAFRVVQAIGGTAMLSTGPAILTDTFPATQRGRALGMTSISVALGLTVGPLLGAVLVSTLGWQWIFFINVPVGVVAVVMAFLIIQERQRSHAGRFDALGALFAFLTLFGLLLALSLGGEWGWLSARTIGALALCVAAFIAFVVTERRVPDPMLDLTLFRSRLFSAANASAALNYLGMFVVIFLTPFYLEHVFRLPTPAVGALLTAVPLATAVLAPVSGILSDRIGSRLLSSAGLAISALALLALSFTSPAAGLTGVGLSLALLGVGSGLFQSPNSSAVMGSVPRRRLGIASAMLATMRNVGMVLGVALAGAVVSAAAPGGYGDPAYLSAIHLAFRVAAAFVALGVVTSLVRGDAGPAEE